MNTPDGRSWPAIYKPHTPITEWDWTYSTHSDPDANGHTFPVQYCGVNESVAMVVPFRPSSGDYEWPLFILDLPHAGTVNAQTSIIWGYEYRKGFTGCDPSKTPSNTANLGFEFILTAERLYLREAVDGSIITVDMESEWTDQFIALNGVSETAWTNYIPNDRYHNGFGVQWTATTLNVECWVWQYQGGAQPVYLLNNLQLSQAVQSPSGPTLVVGMGEPPVAAPNGTRGNCWRPRIICCGLDS